MHIHGGDIYTKENIVDFSANINPLGMPERVKEAALNSIENAIYYPDTKNRKIKNAISAWLSVDESSLYIGNGAADVISTLVSNVKPKRALIAVPTFSEYEKALALNDCETVFHDMTALASDEISDIRLTDAILDKIDESIDMVFICNPNNPTGALASKELLCRILEKCEKRNCMLVVDECFIELCEDGESMISECETSNRLFIIRAFTKSFAMPGLRLGYGICADVSLIEKMNENALCWRVSNVAESAGVAACKESDFLQDSARYISCERDILKEFFRSLSFEVADSKANFIFIKGDESLAKKLYDKNIVLRDCRNFKGLKPGYFRIAVRTHEENEILMEAVREIYG